MKIPAMLVLVLLTGCATTFEAQPKTTRTMVEWHLVSDPDQHCRKLGATTRPGYGIQACAQFYPDFSLCRIYTARRTSLEILGHELRHCFEGKWHD